jgi:hypothetical protein
VSASAPAPAVTDAATDAGVEGAADAAPLAPSGDVVAPEAATAAATAADVAARPGPATASAPVVSPPSVALEAPVLSRTLVVADLPFLVTAPPPLTVAEAETVARDGSGDGRAPSGARATVNPFAPVIMRAAPVPERAVPTATAQPIVTDVAVPTAPTAAAAIPGPRVTAPAPQVRTPVAAPVRDLPRALPTGAPLASTPDLLRQPQFTAERVDVTGAVTVRVPPPDPAVVASSLLPSATAARGTPPDVLVQATAPLERVDVMGVAAIRVPDAQAAAVGDGGTAGVSTTPTTTLPQILGQGGADRGDAMLGAASTNAPLAAGANALSRYLRDNAFTFTGSALGPVSVGVFRSRTSPGPIVVALGQTLPDTDIVLTDLRGYQAELTLGNMTQILVIELRR